MIEFDLIIRQAPSLGRRSPEVHVISASLPSIPQKGDDIVLYQHGGETYTVLAVTHEFTIDPLGLAAGLTHRGTTTVTITPKGIV